MTPEQQRLARYAEAMGFQDYCMNVEGVLLSDLKIWNPLTDANDALELAEKMDVRFERCLDGTYWADWPKDRRGRGSRADTLPAAICAAVDAVLEKPVEPPHLEGM